MKPRSRVLIVDDMVVNRMILASFLEMEGIASDEAESGMECIELCGKNDYDLILLDHRMPGLDGIDTFTALKKMFQESGRSLPPVICHTTGNAQQNINMYKALGFADVLIKPLQSQQVSELFSKYLNAQPDIEKKSDSGLKPSDSSVVHNIIAIGNIGKNLKEKLSVSGFNLIAVEEGINGLISHAESADIILYCPGGDKNKSESLISYLTYSCFTGRKSLVITAKPAALSHIKEMESAQSARLYAKDTDPEIIVKDIMTLVNSHDEYHREKKIIIVSDDEDFVKAVKQGAKSRPYFVSGISADNAENIFSESPDIIAIDCEIPEFNEIMEKIKAEPAKVPIIFAADDFEKLETSSERPDGYFRKSDSELIDFVDRFFAEMIFRKSRSHQEE